MPNPNGPLGKAMPSLSISAANSEVHAVLESAASENKERTVCQVHTQQKAMIGKRASEHGVAAVLYIAVANSRLASHLYACAHMHF